MKKTYQIHGMTCNGCRSHVEDTLRDVEGVQDVLVDLQKTTAEIDFDEEIPLVTFQKALQDDGGIYSIHPEGVMEKKPEPKSALPSIGKQKGKFYCPMHCEGDKIYPEAGDCPVCGMDLVEEKSVEPATVKWTCPMHPEVEKDSPGDCPICGMDLVPMEPEESAEEKTYKGLLRKLWIAVGFTAPIFAVSMGEMIPGNPIFGFLSQQTWNWVQFALSIPVVFYAAWIFFQRAYRSLKTWNLNMFTLIGIGAGVAWLFSLFGLIFPDFFPDQFKTDSGAVHVYFEATAVILTLVLLGQVLEAKAHSKTNSAIKELLNLTPAKATLVKGKEEKEVSIDTIRNGDFLRVKPGGKVPVDGKVMDGVSTIDESMITGEPIPVDISEGSDVHGGTLNGSGSFLMKAEKVGSETLLSQIVKMVNEASRSRAPIQKLADKVSAYFVPIVVLISLITFAVWSIWGPDPALVFALVNSIAVLIIACPCALGLATPMSVMVGVGKGAQNGILIKNAEALELLNKVDTVVLDKTGTITEGKPTVQEFGVQKGLTEKEALDYILSLNASSEHPLAKAAVAFAEEKGAEKTPVSGFQAILGKGVIAEFDGKAIGLGNMALMNQLHVQLDDSNLEPIKALQERGLTVSFLAVDGTFEAFIAFGDEIKANSRTSIESLQRQGIEVLMLTGDQKATAQYVAKELDLNGVYAEMLPEDKLKIVEELQGKGKVVAVAGDGINDAPALAKADVGIAMGTGTDVAIESGSVTLVKGDLAALVKAKNLSKSVIKNIRQNLFFALIYNTLGVPIAAGVLFPFFGVLLSPMIAALAMSFSSVSVIANSLRLRTVDLSK